MGSPTDTEFQSLLQEHQRLQKRTDRLQEERRRLLAANAKLVALAAGHDPAAVVRATYDGDPTLTLRTFAGFQGLQPEEDDRLLPEVLEKVSGRQFIDLEEMTAFCRELRRVLRAFRPARSLACLRCGEPGVLAAALVNGRYPAFRFHHRGGKATHAGTQDGRAPRLLLAVTSDDAEA